MFCFYGSKLQGNFHFRSSISVHCRVTFVTESSHRDIPANLSVSVQAGRRGTDLHVGAQCVRVELLAVVVPRHQYGRRHNLRKTGLFVCFYWNLHSLLELQCAGHVFFFSFYYITSEISSALHAMWTTINSHLSNFRLRFQIPTAAATNLYLHH